MKLLYPGIGGALQAAVWFEDDDVHAALSRIGLMLTPLKDAVRAGYVARISRTANDAPNAGGFYQWNGTLRSLREELVLRSWHRSDSENFSTVVNSDGSIAIAVSSGNSSTGRRNEHPSTKRLKGSCTTAIVSANAHQLELFPEMNAQGSEVPEQGPITWMLLFYTDRDELRSELSLPDKMDDGQITSWKTRIILPPEPLDPQVNMQPPDFGPDIDINIQRR